MRDNVILAFSIICSGSFFLSTDNTEPSHILLIKGNSDRVYPSNIIPASSDIIPTERHLPQSWFLIAAVVASLKMNLYLTGSSALFFWSTSSCLRVSDSSAPLRSSLFSFDNNAFSEPLKALPCFSRQPVHFCIWNITASPAGTGASLIICPLRFFVLRTRQASGKKRPAPQCIQSADINQILADKWNSAQGRRCHKPKGSLRNLLSFNNGITNEWRQRTQGNSSQGWPNDIVTSLYTDIKALQFWLLIAKIAVKSIWGKIFVDLMVK